MFWSRPVLTSPGRELFEVDNIFACLERSVTHGLAMNKSHHLASRCMRSSSLPLDTTCSDINRIGVLSAAKLDVPWHIQLRLISGLTYSASCIFCRPEAYYLLRARLQEGSMAMSIQPETEVIQSTQVAITNPHDIRKSN